LTDNNIYHSGRHRMRAAQTPWEQHVEDRLDAQDVKLDEILAAFKGSKVAFAVISGLASVAAALAIVWHNLMGKA
jgi:hypothetical protein